MTKTYCDSCGKVIKNNNINVVPIATHITSERDSGYTDDDFNPISGISEQYEQCNKCYNICMTAFWNEFKKIEKEKLNYLSNIKERY